MCCQKVGRMHVGRERKLIRKQGVSHRYVLLIIQEFNKVIKKEKRQKKQVFHNSVGKI